MEITEKELFNLMFSTYYSAKELVKAHEIGEYISQKINKFKEDKVNCLKPKE
jgi:hypothetical protein